jgi:hypothetical protein
MRTGVTGQACAQDKYAHRSDRTSMCAGQACATDHITKGGWAPVRLRTPGPSTGPPPPRVCSAWATVPGAVIRHDPPVSGAVIRHDPPVSGAVIRHDPPVSGAVIRHDPQGTHCNTQRRVSARMPSHPLLTPSAPDSGGTHTGRGSPVAAPRRGRTRGGRHGAPAMRPTIQLGASAVAVNVSSHWRNTIPGVVNRVSSRASCRSATGCQPCTNRASSHTAPLATPTTISQRLRRPIGPRLGRGLALWQNPCYWLPAVKCELHRAVACAIAD